MGSQASKQIVPVVGKTAGNAASVARSNITPQATKPSVNIRNTDEDWTKRPQEDDKVLQNFKSIQFAVKTVEATIRKDTKALETLRNRQVIQRQQTASVDQPSRMTVPGTLSISQVHEMLGYRRVSPDQWPVERLANHFSVDTLLVEQLIKHYNIYETVGNAKEGFYGTWAHHVMPRINPMPSETRVKRALDRIKYEESLDRAPGRIDQPL